MGETIAPISGVDQQKSQLDAVTQGILARASAPQAGGMQQPVPRAGADQLSKQGYNMQHNTNKKADAGQAIGNFGTFVHNMVAQHKQNQIRDAMSEWQGFNHSLENAQALAGDPSAPDYQQKVQKMLAQDPWIKANLDPANPKAQKRLKNMYKALNVDLLEGDKDNVHRDGLKRFFQVNTAMQKVKEMGQKMAGHQQQKPPMDAQKQQGMFQEGLQKLMSQQTFQKPDMARQEEAARLAMESKRMQMDKFDFKQGVDPDTNKPTWFAFDKTNPNAPPKKMQVDGKDIGVQSKFSEAQHGKVMSIGSKPYGVVGPHGVIVPGDPEWTDKDTRNYDAANKAYAVQEADKEKNTRIRTDTYLDSREYSVIKNSPDGTHKLMMIGPRAINAAPPGTYSPAGAGMTAEGKEAKFQDIYWMLDNVETAAKNLKHPLDVKTRAMMISALQSNDPAKFLGQLRSSAAIQALPEDVQDYITAMAGLQENSMALASLGGYGAGSDAVREAIAKTVPNVGTPNLRYLERQISLVRGQAQRLEKGVPGMGADTVISDPSKVPD
jgi:hypothetical protein